MRISIEDWNEDGRGRGHVGKKAVLVSQAHPGEEVAVRVDRTTRGAVQGRVARLIGEASARVETPCEHRFHCTGCPFLCLDPSAESAFKVERVVRALEGVPAAPSPEAIIRPAGPYGYRHYAKQVVARRGRRVVLGSYVAGTHHVTDNAGCSVLAEPLPSILREIAEEATSRDLAVHEPDRDGGGTGLRYVTARFGRRTGGGLVVLVTSDPDPSSVVQFGRDLFDRRADVASVWVMVNPEEGNALLAGERIHVAGAMTIEEELLGFGHHVGPSSFFQVNPVAAESLFALAREFAGGGARVLEGYAGVGALTLPLSERFGHVVAIEAHAEAHDLLRAASEGLRIDARLGTAEDLLPPALDEGLDAVVLDPPRKGLGTTVVGALAARGPARVVLLSCDPATLGRDLPALVAAGYEARRVVPVDQFPRTAHVETVTLLERLST